MKKVTRIKSRVSVLFFVAVKQIATLEKGLYTYIPKDHALTRVDENIEIDFCLIVSADLDYATQQYGEREYRFCLLEAGHMVQNMMLVASALEKAIAPIGGFKDEYINQNILGNGLSALYLVPVGKTFNLPYTIGRSCGGSTVPVSGDFVAFGGDDYDFA